MGSAQPLGPALDIDCTPAFMFRSRDGEQFGVSLDREGHNLPRGEGQRWEICAEFNLGVHEPVPASIDPEPLLRGIKSQGFFVWPARRILPMGTAQ